MRRQAGRSIPKRFERDLTGQKVQQALSLHQSGQRMLAKAIYAEILASQPNHFDALQLSGLLAYESQQFDDAEKFFLKALKVRSNSAGLYSNYGTLLHRLRRYEEAIAKYKQALSIDSGLMVARVNMGVAYTMLKRYDEAIDCLDKVIELNPKHVEAFFSRANAHKEAKRFQQAIDDYDRAISLNPNYFDAFVQRGNALREMERLEKALADFDRALSIKKNNADAYSGRGLVLHQLNRPEEALEAYAAALALDPQDAQVYSYRGIVLHSLKRYDEALADLERSIAIRPDYAAAYSNLGVVLKDIRRFNDAIAAFFNAVTLDKNKPSVYWNLATLLLLIGNFRDGWEFYEWRKKIEKPFGARQFNRPVWLGKESLEGKAIMIHAEQGIGDVIQFSRYVKMLVPLAGKVIFAVPDKLIGLMRGLGGDIEIISDKEITASFDCHCPLMSLPFAFGTEVETIPAGIPYISADKGLAQSLRRRLSKYGAKKVCGLSWYSKSEKTGSLRNITLMELFAAIDPSDYVFVNLQYGDVSAEVAELRRLKGIEIVCVDEIDNYHDLDGFAALVDACDVILSIDNTTIHVAGALGKETLVMLPYVPDWRWLLDRENAPWYPTMRLFRQDVQDEWTLVLAQVSDVLRGSPARAPFSQSIAIGPVPSRWIGQIYYNEETRVKVEPGFIPLDNMANPRPDWFEFWVIRNNLHQMHMMEDCFYGFLSPKFSAKTGLNSAQVNKILDGVGGDFDVVSFTAHPAELIVNINPFIQGERWHPGLLEACDAFVRVAGLDIDPKSVVTTLNNSVFSNYFVAKPAFWRDWLALADLLYECAEDPGGNIYGVLNRNVSYRLGARLDAKVFVQERLATILLNLGSYKVFVPPCICELPMFRGPERQTLLSLESLKVEFNERKDPELLVEFEMRLRSTHLLENPRLYATVRNALKPI